MLNWIEVLLRTIGMVLLLFFVAKLSSKKQVAQLSYFDYISRISLGGIAAIMVVDLRVNFLYGVLAIIVWIGITYTLDFIALKSKIFRDFIEGKGIVLIKDGKIMEENLKKEQFTTDMLLKQLRSKNVFKFADVEFAVLEPTGEVNILLKRNMQPVTLKDLHEKIPNEKEPQTVIMDGKILNEPLATLGLSPAWLLSQLEKQGFSIDNVFLAQVDSYGQVTVDLYDDKIKVPQPTELPLLLSSLKKSQADLELFALETENKDAKQMYMKNAEKVKDIILKVTPILQ